MQSPAFLPAILIAEDNPDDLLLLQCNLRKAGIRHPVITFSSGGDILEFLALSRVPHSMSHWIDVCVLFLDIQLPYIDGLKVLEWIRADELFRPLSVAIVTGSTGVEERADADRLGCDGYLQKPAVIADLQRIVEKARPLRLGASVHLARA